MAKIDRCRWCGFLAMRNNSTYHLDEVPENVRISGRYPDHWEGPICYRKAQPITDEYKAVNQQNRSATDIFKEIIEKDRKCIKARKYLPEFSPKEHFKMLLSERTVKIERQRLEDDRKWRDEQDKKRAAEDRKWKQSERFRNWIEIVAIIILAPLAAWAIPHFLDKQIPTQTSPPSAVHTEVSRPPAAEKSLPEKDKDSADSQTETPIHPNTDPNASH